MTARKRPIQPATRDEQTLAEGRHVFDRASAHFAAFQALDAENKVKLFPRARLTALGTLVREVSTAMTAHALGTDEALGGTASEAALRDELVEHVRAIRDRIAAAYPDNREIARACGVGKRLAEVEPEPDGDVGRAAAGVRARELRAEDARGRCAP